MTWLILVIGAAVFLFWLGFYFGVQFARAWRNEKSWRGQSWS